MGNLDLAFSPQWDTRNGEDAELHSRVRLQMSVGLVRYV